MKTDDLEQESSRLVNISQEQRDTLAEKIMYKKSLSAEDRQEIFFILTGDWNPKSFFRKTRGPKFKGSNLRALAEDVEKLEETGIKFPNKTLQSELGEKHHLQGTNEVSLATFTNNLKSGQKSLRELRLFLEIVEIRKDRKNLK
ncbi:hypothetical protein [Desulfuromonas soudanensis]|uniref:hypothetical protein n=1 Tax=Desulfuromonas soudanensis TaxID=1603606 RepID=UPI0006AD3B99|nr:hypothetical protein [Desulfuromonas soudanensis]